MAFSAIIPIAVGISLTAINGDVSQEANAASTYSHTITAKTWSTYGTKTLSGVNWTATATGGSYWGYDATKGQQFGSKSSPAKPLTLSTSGFSGSITSISISTSGASSVVANLGVTVGGSAFVGLPKTITSSNAAYNFTGNATGEIVFSWTQTSSKALYVKAIEIVYSSKTLASLSTSGTLTKNSYYEGESFDSTGLTITATYDDNSTAIVTSQCSFAPSPLTQGTTSVTVSYTEGEITRTTSVSGLTVNAPISLSNIAVSGTASKTTYYAGENFDPTGITVTATYSNSSTADVTSSCTYTPSPLTQGTTSVTVSYTEGEITRTASVSGLTVNAALSSTTVSFGSGSEDNGWTESAQNIGSDYVGLATTSHYVQTSAATLLGVNAILDSSLIVKFKVGTYGGTPATMPTITVALLDASNNVLSSASGSPTLTGSSESYVQGPTISVTKPANPSSISTIKVYISDVGAMTAAVYMRLEQLRLSFSTIAGITLSSIAVTSQPTNKTYYSGDSLDTTGMVITATYSDSSTADVTSSCTYTPNPLTAGTTSVTATYVEGAITQTAIISGINVIERALNTISIKTPTSKTSFTLGEQFAYPGLVVNANWNSGTVELTSGFTVTGVDTMKLGTQTATITYESQTITYSVNVTNQGARVGDVANTSELFISEYYEGDSNDKYIEIYNGTSSAIDLTTSEYRIKIDANGAGTWAASNIDLTGTIPAYGTFVLAHSSANASILALANQLHGSVTHNGDDSVGLFKGATLIDLFGVLGTNPGTGWTIGEIENATVNHVIVRKSSVTAPASTWNTAEWDVYANTLDYLGSHTTNSADVTSLQQATAFANYVMTGIGLNAQGSCTSVLEALVTEYNYMSEDAKLEFETAPEELFVNARARMAYLQAWVSANTPDGLSAPIQEFINSSTIIIVASLGLGTVIAYFFLKRKKAL